MIERAGLWRRGAAALVDMALALVLVQGLAAAGFQLTGGRVTTGFGLSTVCRPTTADAVDMPRGDAVPAGFAPDRAALCRSTVLGATTGLAYVLSRTETHAGLDVTIRRAFPVDLAWRAADGRVDLDPFLLPLFVLVRWAFDRFAGATPGRWLARIRVAEAEATGARVGAALGAQLTRRYLLFARPYAPILAVGAAEALFGVLTGSASPFAAVAAGIATAVAVASQAVAAAAILEGRSTFYDRPCATRVADLASLEPPRPVGTGVTGVAAAPASAAGMSSRRRPVPPSGRLSWPMVLLACAGALWIGRWLPPPVRDVPPVPVVGRPAAVAGRPAAIPSRPAEIASRAPPSAEAVGPAPPIFGADVVAAQSAEAAEIAARAEVEAKRGETSASLEDVAYAIAVEQGVADNAASRDFASEVEAIVGHNLFLAGDLADAVVEDTRALAIKAGDVRVLKQRAIAEFFMSEQVDALDDLDATLVNAPGDMEAALWRDIVARRLAQPSRIDADTFAADLAGWPGPIVDLFRGRLSPEALRARVLDFDLATWKQRQCEADFYIGEWHLMRGEADPARDALREALKDCSADAMEAHEAEDELLGRAGFR